MVIPPFFIQHWRPRIPSRKPFGPLFHSNHNLFKLPAIELHCSVLLHLRRPNKMKVSTLFTDIVRDAMSSDSEEEDRIIGPVISIAAIAIKDENSLG